MVEVSLNVGMEAKTSRLMVGQESQVRNPLTTSFSASEVFEQIGRFLGG